MANRRRPHSDQPPAPNPQPPIITLLTDFGVADAYVGIMKGVICGICPTARLIDLTHEVPAQQIAVGALLLRSAAGYFPNGTIHLAVVDPGVGSRRNAIVIETARALFVGPDNGLLQPAAAAFGIQRVIAIEAPELRLPAVSRTFHGRDVFAPAAAHLARGVRPEAFGRRLDSVAPLALPEPVRTGESLVGEVVHVDRFGNLITNLTSEELSRFPASPPSVSIAGCAPIPLVETYADVAPGELAGLIGSWGQLEVAVRDGSAAERLGAGLAAKVVVRPR